MEDVSLKNTLLQSLVIAIDGPAGSGKSTTARLAAENLHLRYIDTGAMYRAVTLKALENDFDLENGDQLGDLTSRSSIELESEHGGAIKVFIDGRDVTRDIRTPEVSGSVSLVSAHPSVRKALVHEQRRLSQAGGVVMDGRDIGSVVLPHADVKVYIEASVETRAQRRLLELEEKGIETTLESVLNDIEKRDQYDSSREASPLRAAIGACTIDTTELTIEEQVQKVVALAERKASELAELHISGDEGPTKVEKIHRLYRFGQKLLILLLKGIWGIRIIKNEKGRYNEAYIYACNHLSYADPPLVGSTLPREVHFLAKESLFRNRVFGWLIRTFNAIPLRRSFDREKMQNVINLLETGESILIFPEGTRVRGGRLGKAMGGIGYLALNSLAPVVPLYVSGSNRLLDCLLRKRRLVVVHGRPLRLTVKAENANFNIEDYKAYSEMVMEAIDALKENVD